MAVSSIQTDGGSTWHDILLGDGSTVGEDPGRFINGAYTGFVSVGTGHPFGGERAWTGFDMVGPKRWWISQILSV